ncbi:hypothetical protein C7U92_15410 [Bradyrhizobium sp. WBOS7]|uniref:Uncharacterized protein n=1 Tax=Bradyrhizobium betae TaxID=244734 RepID=A0AAE9NEA4_9BRAD|nr:MULTISPECIES: hypothetical protein [Bradyrhizobium]MDD1572252.1 hypothetical protein [Bradyrhizobium sp. WBOS1]UUO36955.1 hypothetical protein DCK84_21870 [Bradyrhizobium sp. WBOS01]MDD1529113.1 hypothetical protein [Bradyrhizobium sp. WBOS2]MDD1578110.1 hypothetical protein [Bradyrhizobium sp. WBOS7]MDD1601512.1 hypothetical protein [Bradyrhizobium sp. WBOS16]
MKKIMLAASLVVLLGGAAIAQTGAKGSTSSGANSGSVPPAPVGHRQPRAADVPSKTVSDPNDPLSKENQALDKKIKSICRGC